MAKAISYASLFPGNTSRRNSSNSNGPGVLCAAFRCSEAMEARTAAHDSRMKNITLANRVLKLRQESGGKSAKIRLFLRQRRFAEGTIMPLAGFLGFN